MKNCGEIREYILKLIKENRLDELEEVVEEVMVELEAQRYIY